MTRIGPGPRGAGGGILRRPLPVLTLVALACAATEPPAGSPASPASPAGSSEPSTPATVDSALTGYPWARLVDRDNPVEPLELSLPDAALSQLGVKSSRSYTATTPRIWLLAFEFETQAQLFEAEPKVLELIGSGPPYYPQTAHTGGWLLVAGFPSEKPVSPEMQHALDDFRSAWAGEE